MKAVVISEKGSLDNLEILELPIPVINPDQVLVKIKACGINPVDWKGVILSYFQMPSYILGTDISGIVENVGAAVNTFKIGDEVIGSLEWAKQGAFAEYVATEEKYLARKPKNLTFEEAAAVPLAALTAWQGLFDKLNIQAGEKILIQAAAGGVGIFAVQFAKWKGAHVVAVASEKNIAFLKSLGADEILNYHTADFSAMPNDFDAVFDSMASAEQTFKVLKKEGRYVSITATPSAELAASYGISSTNFLFISDAVQLNKIVNLIEQEKVKVFLDKVFPLTAAKEALAYQQLGHSKGKNVFSVA
jgi:NADPH:quinone reductase-like Zn-dependent oxidoreductase